MSVGGPWLASQREGRRVQKGAERVGAWWMNVHIPYFGWNE